MSSSSDDDDEPRTVETTDRTNENVSSPRPEDTKDTRDDVCLDNDDAWSVRRSAMNMNGWRRSCFFCRLVLLLVVKFVPKLFSVCSPSFLLCALKMSKSSTPKNHRLKIFPPKMLMNYQKVTKNREVVVFSLRTRSR